MSKKVKVYLTDHSKVRFDERTNISAASRTDVATAAFKKGYEFAEFKEPLATFLKSISYDDGKYVAKIYKEYVYIFNNYHGHRLLTVYSIPEEYLPVEKYLIPENELESCMIALTSKKDGKILFWSECSAPTDDICEALEFKTQIRAQNYINNNKELDLYKDKYEIEIF